MFRLLKRFTLLYLCTIGLVLAEAEIPIDDLILNTSGQYLDRNANAPYSGWAVLYDENERLIFRVAIQDGFKSGLEQSWNSEGNLEYELYYQQGKPLSYLSRWYGNEPGQDKESFVRCADMNVSSSAYQQLCNPADKGGSSRFENCADNDCGIPDQQDATSYFEDCSKVDCGLDL